MLGYYVDLALRSLKRTPILTGLMVLAIALGIGASMTTLTVLRVLSGNPIPSKSSTLYFPQIDPRDLFDYARGVEPPRQVTWIDGMNLLRATRADRQALMTGGNVAIQSTQPNLDPFFEPARFTTAGFFPMFDVQFQYGHSWSTTDDEDRARVVVISHALNDRLFAGKDSVGQTLRLAGHEFRITGVLGDWRPNPQFYDLTRKSYNENEGVYVPLSTSQDVRFDHDGDVECWGNGGGVRMNQNTPCVWLQFWVQLDTPGKAAAYKQFLIQYSEEQRASGRFQRPPNVRLRDVMQWLDYNGVVPKDVRLQTWLAFGFLLVCLVNTVGLMLAKFTRRQGELSVRRAMGASRRALFGQLLVESGAVGLAGGIGGLLLALLGLSLVRHRPTEYASLAHLDPAMLLITFLLAIGASLLSGVLPARRVSYVPPALQLKSE
ncbi:MAG TPA: ABC transporter permease [Steroidobacteraceae bacterium]|jgi:putative ABC transport system permease protein|nr:ABC transporter permease [Steroidobacteraceae bacterium]